MGVPVPTVGGAILGRTTFTPVTRFGGLATSLLAPAVESGATDAGGGVAVRE